MKNLPLDRPLVAFDLETTGTDPLQDRIVEIAIIRLEPAGPQQSFRSLVNPQMPIPPEATRIHGISDQDVADQPTFAQLAAHVARLLDGADLAGFNSIRFDQPFLAQEFLRAQVAVVWEGRRHLDALRIYHIKERRDLSAAVRFYCGRELQGAHSALADAAATLEVLDAQLARYDDLPRDVGQLHQLCNTADPRFLEPSRKLEWNREGKASISFGRHRGRSLEELAEKEPDYLRWIVAQDFTPEVKKIASEALKGKFPKRG